MTEFFTSIIDWGAQSQRLAALVFLGIFLVKPFIMFPPSPLLYISAGVIFPTWMAIAVLYVCIAMQISIGYFNGKILGEKRVKALLGKRKWASSFVSKEKDNLLPICFVTRVLPFPKDPLSMFYGAMGMPYLRFLIVSLLGLTPVMVPLTLAAAAIEYPLTPEFLIPFAVCLVISTVLLIIFKIKTRTQKPSEAA